MKHNKTQQMHNTKDEKVMPNEVPESSSDKIVITDKEVIALFNSIDVNDIEAVKDYVHEYIGELMFKEFLNTPPEDIPTPKRFGQLDTFRIEKDIFEDYLNAFVEVINKNRERFNVIKVNDVVNKVGNNKTIPFSIESLLKIKSCTIDEISCENAQKLISIYCDNIHKSKHVYGKLYDIRKSLNEMINGGSTSRMYIEMYDFLGREIYTPNLSLSLCMYQDFDDSLKYLDMSAFNVINFNRNQHYNKYSYFKTNHIEENLSFYVNVLYEKTDLLLNDELKQVLDNIEEHFEIIDRDNYPVIRARLLFSWDEKLNSYVVEFVNVMQFKEMDSFHFNCKLGV